MGAPTRYLRICLILGISTIKVACLPTCDVNFYYDVVTRTCSPCSAICLNAGQQRTVDLCQALCKGYVVPGGDAPTDSGVGEDGKWPTAATVATAITGVVVFLFVTVATVKYRREIQSRCRSQQCPRLYARPNANDIEMQPMSVTADETSGDGDHVEVTGADEDHINETGADEAMDVHGIPERGRQQHGHKDIPEPGVEDDGGLIGGIHIGGTKRVLEENDNNQ